MSKSSKRNVFLEIHSKLLATVTHKCIIIANITTYLIHHSPYVIQMNNVFVIF